jgi:hypothetical protein
MPQLSELHKQGKLLAVHAQNLWWGDNKNISRPSWLHCLPIGLENRRWPKGGNLEGYMSKIREVLLKRPPNYSSLNSDRPLLLVAFSKRPRVPDRGDALREIHSLVKPGEPTFFDISPALSHMQWLEEIARYRFTMCPFGHGLDTHRLWEVLLMGGIPVVKRSTITSCVDDSDNVISVLADAATNTFTTVKRGSIPVVVVDKWTDLSKELLETSWKKFVESDITWDYRRILLHSWRERILGS